MYIATIFSILIILFVLIIFSFPRFSPIPYFPSNKKDLPLIIKALELKNNQTIVDLGAGDGIIIFETAQKAFEKKLNTKFVAIEINIILILILHLRRFFHPNKNNIKIIWGDLFKARMQQFDNVTIYLYVSPWLIDKIIKNYKLKIKNLSVVSYMYPVKSLKPKKVIKGINRIYQYN